MKTTNTTNTRSIYELLSATKRTNWHSKRRYEVL